MVQRPRPDLRAGAQQYAFLPQLRGVPSNGDSYRDRLGESQDGFGVFIHGCCDWNF